MSALQQTFRPIVAKQFEPMMVRQEVISAVVTGCRIEFDDDDLDDAISEQRLPAVFDISVRGASGERSRTIFFPPAVQHFIDRTNNPRVPLRPFYFEHLFRLMLPHGLRAKGGLAIKSPTLVLAWNCSTELVIDLIRAAHLRQFGHSEFRRGHGGEALIDVRSVETFLLKRRLPKDAL